MKRSTIVACARSWDGTPWHHAACVKGVGVDCVQLIAGVLDELGVARPALPAYDRTPDGTTLMAMCDKHLDRVAQRDMGPGDIVVIRWRDGVPHHAGILGDHRHGGLSLIHANSAPELMRVVEHRLLWTPQMRLVAAFRLPEVDA
jgi:NlpC/P60 family putative phage cell wall peptidase